MRITRYTDYSLRVMIYLALQPERLSSIHEISESYGISEAHLMKVVQRLGQLGYVATLRGRGGGLRLAKAAEDIRIGELVRATEDDLALVECFADPDACCITEPCKLRHVLRQALEAFLGVLDAYTLADVTTRPRAKALKACLGLDAAE